MNNPYADPFMKQAQADAQIGYMGIQLKEVWGILHRLVAATRGTMELNHPRAYKVYDDLCEEYGEEARREYIDKSPREASFK